MKIPGSSKSAGTLVLPETHLFWAGREIPAQWFSNLTIQWGEGTDGASMSFNLDPLTPLALFVQSDKAKLGTGTEVSFVIGYPGDSNRRFTGRFIHTGTTHNSGTDQSIQLTCSHPTWVLTQADIENLSWVSDSSTPLYAQDILRDVAKSHGVNMDVVGKKTQVAFVSQAETPAEFINRQANATGDSMRLVLDPATCHGHHCVMAPAADTSKDQPLTAKPPKKGKELASQSDPLVYYLGVGAVTTITRSMVAQKATQQRDNTSRSNAKLPQNIEKAIAEAKAANRNPAKTKAGTPQTTEQVRTGSPLRTNQAVPADESKDAVTTDTKASESDESKQLVASEELTASMSTTVYMCPRFVGIKPRDYIIIPSAEAGKDYRVNSVTYSQQGAGFAISIEASRWMKPDVMAQNWPAIEADIKAQGLDGGKDSTSAWQKYYWGGQR